MMFVGCGWCCCFFFSSPPVDTFWFFVLFSCERRKTRLNNCCWWWSCAAANTCNVATQQQQLLPYGPARFSSRFTKHCLAIINLKRVERTWNDIEIIYQTRRTINFSSRYIVKSFHGFTCHCRSLFSLPSISFIVFFIMMRE